jgi:hypothetical protein
MGTANHAPAVGGASPATAFVSGLAADVRSIAPAMSPSLVRGVLFLAACRKGNTLRADGTNCTPSADARVNVATNFAGIGGLGGGYIDALDALRWARLNAARPHLAPCTGGWDANERTANPAHDSALAALDLGALNAQTGSTVEYRGSGDLSIHALTRGRGSDQDWYQFSFNRAPRKLRPTAPRAIATARTAALPRHPAQRDCCPARRAPRQQAQHQPNRTNPLT